MFRFTYNNWNIIFTYNSESVRAKQSYSKQLTTLLLFFFLFRNLLAFIYIPVLQRELNIFKTTIWNNHRIRKQKNKELPTGLPEHIYQCPEQYGGEKCGVPLKEEDLLEAARLSEVLVDTDDYLEVNFRQECERHIPDIDDIKSTDAATAYLYLRSNFDKNRL